MNIINILLKWIKINKIISFMTILWKINLNKKELGKNYINQEN